MVIFGDPQRTYYPQELGWSNGLLASWLSARWFCKVGIELWHSYGVILRAVATIVHYISHITACFLSLSHVHYDDMAVYIITHSLCVSLLTIWHPSCHTPATHTTLWTLTNNTPSKLALITLITVHLLYLYTCCIVPPCTYILYTNSLKVFRLTQELAEANCLFDWAMLMTRPNDGVIGTFWSVVDG